MKNRIKNNKCIECKTSIDDRAKRCKKCSLLHQKGKNHPNYKNRTVILKCAYCSRKIKKQLSQVKDVNHVFCNFICMGLYRETQYIGKNNPAWIDGSSYKNYPYYFTESLRESIRKRDNYSCQNCGMTEEEHLIVYGQILEIHHINYNKENCKKDNLITLCKGCNLRANYNRDYWKEVYNKKIEVID